jgi:hypothetical protein
MNDADNRGDWKAVEAALRAEIAEKDKRIETLFGQLESSLVDANATANGVPELLLPHARKQIKMAEEDGRFKFSVVNAKGEPRINSRGNPLSISELVAEMKGNKIFGRVFEGEGSTGNAPRPSNGVGETGTSITRRSDLKGDNKVISAFVDAYGLDAYKALPL